MYTNLSKDEFIKGWNGVPGHGIEPFIAYGKNFMRSSLKGTGAGSAIRMSFDDLLETAVNDAISYTMETLDKYDETKGSFKTFFAFRCKKMLHKTIDKEKGKEMPEELARQLGNEEPDDEDVCSFDPQKSMMYRESKDYRSKALKTVIDTIDNLHPEERWMLAVDFGLRSLMSEKEKQEYAEAFRKYGKCRKAAAALVAARFGISEESARQKLTRAEKRLSRKVTSIPGFSLEDFSRGSSFCGFLVNTPEPFTVDDIKALSFEDLMEVVFHLYLTISRP
ncbi:MAG: hypothetical protein IK045_04675 [Bacteroidales bacterium]|nr:hypothetical protein [Bacteroidales bacterium]